MKCKLVDVAEFNPKELLKKGIIAKKVAMDQLRPFCRDIPGYTLEPFNGGAKFRNGDTIMARITPCLENGKTAKVNILDDGEIGFGSTEYIVFRAKEGISDEDYLYYLICSPIVRDAAIKSMVGSSGRQRVQTDVVQNLEIDLPPIAEQKKVGALLRSLDDKIELNNKIAENLLEQVDMLYECIFSNERNFSELGNVIKTTSGGTPSRKHPELYENPSICWVKSKELNGGFIHNTEEMINEIALSNSAAKILPAHCVLVAMYGATVGEYGIIASPMTCNQAVCALIPNNRYPYPYLYELIRHSKEKLKNMAVGSAQQNISQVLIKQLPVHVNIDKVEQFTDATIASFQMIETLTLENIRLTFIRDTLLPKLMSGEIDIGDVDI